MKSEPLGLSSFLTFVSVVVFTCSMRHEWKNKEKEEKN
jgi:hypothetical protein